MKSIQDQSEQQEQRMDFLQKTIDERIQGVVSQVGHRSTLKPACPFC